MSSVHDVSDLKPGVVYTVHDQNPPVIINQGMTLRDYFAAKIMPALVERYECELPDELAREAYDLADAMLAARKP